MTSIPDHVLKDAIVIVPRKRGLKGIVDLSSALMGMLGAAVTASCALLATVAPYLSPKSISLPDWFYIVFGCMPGLALVSFGGWLAFRKSGLDVILGYDTLKGEVILVERRFGRPRAAFQVPLAKVQSIRIYGQAAFSGNPDVGGWNAQLVLLDGKSIPLGNVKGKPIAPPNEWLARFKRVSILLGKPLEILSYADTQQIAYTPVVDQLINNIRQQSSSPGEPRPVLPHFTNARQTTYTPPAASEEQPTVLGNIRRLYKKDKTFRFFVYAMAWGCCFLVADTFNGMVRHNYWLHLLGESAEAFVFALPFIAVFFLRRDPLVLQRAHKLERFALLILIYIICLIFAVGMIDSLVRSSYDLYHGPIYGRGVIERTNRTANIGSYSFITVHGVRYSIPDRNWFKTMELGQEIEFIYGPMTHNAYPLPQSQ